MRFILFCSIVFLLSSDISHDRQTINRLLAQTPTPFATLFHIVSAKPYSGLSEFTRAAIQAGSQMWIEKAALIGNPEAASHLAFNSGDNPPQWRWLSLAAKNNDPLAQYEFALLQTRDSLKEFWLLRAAEQEYSPAYDALYQYYDDNKHYQDASHWLKLAAQHDPQSARLYSGLLWRMGDDYAAIEALQHANSLGDKHALAVLEALQRKDTPTISSGTECVMQIQFVTDDLENASQALQFQEAFAQDNRLTSLPICINPVVVLPHGSLECSADKHGRERLSCEMPALIALTDSYHFDHLVVFAFEGKANVHNGIMYLDSRDTYSVFVHELAHFSGFIDEYPLSKALADVVCSGESAPNLLFIESIHDTEPPKLNAFHPWGREANLTYARTCDKHSRQAVKPSGNMTFMEFHDTNYIPDMYLKQWLNVLRQRRTLIPVYVNFAQYFEAQDDWERASHWWQAYERYTGNKAP